MKKTDDQQHYIIVRAQGTYSTLSRFSLPICGGIGPVSLLLCRSLQNKIKTKNHFQYNLLKTQNLSKSQAPPISFANIDIQSCYINLPNITQCSKNRFRRIPNQ